MIVLIIDRNMIGFEKKSGNALSDQRAMQAIKKAQLLPLISKELSEDTPEMGIRSFRIERC